MTPEAQGMSGACDKSLISRCVTLLAFSFVLMASVNVELSSSTVQIPVADLKRSLRVYNQVTLSSENLGVLNSVTC
jgi:hypothetical protein